MRKINYFIFPIVLVLFIFLSAFKTPLVNATQKEQQGYPIYLLKANFCQYFYEKENVSTHEYLVQYVLEGIITDTINDYFFTFIHYSAINKGYDNEKNSYELENIETGSDIYDWTLITVRFTFTKHWLNGNYGGYEYMNVRPLFTENSAFYVEYDVYNWGYGDGFVDGRDYGRGIGYQEGRVEGWNEGYYKGHDDGYEEGYNRGYDDGYEEGELDGYDEGYQKGYDKGYDDGINTNGDYMQGYNDGFKAGEKSKIAQNNEAFYKSIEKWLVPAIITVIVLGGIESIIAIKRREQ